jgi:hypothetical protein
MRTPFLIAALALAGCPSSGSCPVDTVSSASQCIPIRDMAVPQIADLAHGCVGTAPYCDLYHGPSLCIGGQWWCEGPPLMDMATHD